MLEMPPFDVHLPSTAEEAFRLRMQLPESMYMAGGTDLLPNLKHHLHTPQHVIDLTHILELSGISNSDGGDFRIGGCTTLHDVATHPSIQTALPGLASAVSQIAAPQHRKMGTLGGNVMLDTRCVFYNQSQPWRQALDYCLKKDGTYCHVINSPKACVAAQSSDSVPMLLALNASIEVLDSDGTRHIDLTEVFGKDGRYDRVHLFDEHALVVAIHIPRPKETHRSVYRKVRSRNAVDFPQLGLGIAGQFNGEVCEDLQVAVGAILPQPKRLRGMDFAHGKVLTDEVIQHLAELAQKQVRPQVNIHGSPSWRRHMAKVELKRGLETLRTA